MIQGTIIMKLNWDAYYSPEFRRGGLASTFAISVLSLYGMPTVTVTVQHRNADETSWTDAGNFSAITVAGNSQTDISTLKEILRFKYEFAAGDDATDAMYFAMQAPSWRMY